MRFSNMLASMGSRVSSPSWLTQHTTRCAIEAGKVKCNKQQEFVIAGYTPTEKGLPGFGALILAVYEKGRLVYAGRVGTGFTFKERGDLKKQLVKLSRPSTPFAVTPNDRGLREAVWVEPKLIAEVVFTEWTSDGSIRHPSFQGLREDKKDKEVVRELPNAVPTETKKRKPARAKTKR